MQLNTLEIIWETILYVKKVGYVLGKKMYEI